MHLEVLAWELNVAMAIKYLNGIWFTVSAQRTEATYYNRRELEQVAGFSLSSSLDLRDSKETNITRDLGKSIAKLIFLISFSRAKRNSCPKVWTRTRSWIRVPSVLQASPPSHTCTQAHRTYKCAHTRRHMHTHSHIHTQSSHSKPELLPVTSAPLFVSSRSGPKEKKLMFQACRILTHQNHSDDPLRSFTRHFRHFFMGMGNHISPGIKHIDPKRLELNFKLRTER